MEFTEIIAANYSQHEHVEYTGWVRNYHFRELSTHAIKNGVEYDWRFVSLWSKGITLAEEALWDATQVPYEPGLNAQA